MTLLSGEKHPKEQRRDWRFIKGLVIGQIVTLILALIGLTIAVLDLNAKADSVQTSRIDAKRDNCLLIKGLAYTAAGPGQESKVTAYLDKTPLVDCNSYSKQGITMPEAKLPKGFNYGETGR